MGKDMPDTIFSLKKFTNFSIFSILNPFKTKVSLNTAFWGCRIHQLKEYPDCDSKSSTGEAPALEIGECEVPLHCHCSQVHSDLEW